ncbi:MAG TPA: hypothetical protein VIC08_15650 [Cellvibrionaceae bacterium]
MKQFLKKALSILLALMLLWLILFLWVAVVEYSPPITATVNWRVPAQAATIITGFGLVIFALPSAIIWTLMHSLLATTKLGGASRCFISALLAGLLCPLLLFAFFSGFTLADMLAGLKFIVIVIPVALLSAACYWLLFLYPRKR